MKDEYMSLSTKQINWLVDTILKTMEKEGKLPWHQPWFTSDHHNAITGHHYSGLNPLALSAHAHFYGYKSKRWLTYKQAVDNNIKVTGGYKLAPIVKAGTAPIKKDGEETDKHYFYMKMFTLINGDFLDLPEEADKPEIVKAEDAERIAQNYIKREKLTYQEQGGKAYYSPMMDKVNLPPMQQFKTQEGYYSVLFHELAHSTGHQKRLNRETVTNFAMFGSHDYSIEELIAELTSSFTVKACGLEPDINNSTAYIQSWLRKLKDNKDWIVKASSKAQQAHNYICNTETAS